MKRAFFICSWYIGTDPNSKIECELYIQLIAMPCGRFPYQVWEWQFRMFLIINKLRYCHEM